MYFEKGSSCERKRYISSVIDSQNIFIISVINHWRLKILIRFNNFILHLKKNSNQMCDE